MPFGGIVRACRGAYPTLVLQLLKNMRPEIATKTIEAFALESLSRRNSEIASGLSELEGNPVLSSWYFTSDTCYRLERLQDWSECAIAFMGTPRMYEWFAQKKIGKRRTLLDLDALVIDRLQTLAMARNDEVALADIRDIVPDRLRGQFQWAILDPPWYPEDYQVWISQAMALAPGGTLCISLFPELTRPDASAERLRILRDLKESAGRLTVVSEWLEYQIPSFEECQLAASGITSLGPWKLSDMVICELKPGVRVNPGPRQFQRRDAWFEVDVGALRIFVTDPGDIRPGKELLKIVEGVSLTLPSPSRRLPGLENINVLTSRGDGLTCSYPPELIKILKDLRDVSLRNRSGLADRIDRLSIDHSSRNLLKKLLLTPVVRQKSGRP